MTDKHQDLAYSRCVLATDYEQRLEQYERRLLLGSVAQTLDSSIHNGRWTHQFRVYIKALKEGEVAKAAADMDDSYEPLADYAQKVVFRFSDDCNDCIHIVESPPFESGTFCNNNTTVSVTLLFLDTSHTCTIFHHGVTMPLHSSSRSIQESVRTIIFVNPSIRMKGMLRIPVDVEPEIADAPESPRMAEMVEIRAQEPDEEPVENNPPDEQSQEDDDPPDDSQDDGQEKLGDALPEKESDEIEDYLKEMLDDNSDDDLEEDSEDELEEIEEEQEEEVQDKDKDKQGKEGAGASQAPPNEEQEEEEEKELTEQELELQRQQEELKKDLKRARRAMNQERRFIVNPGPRDL